MEKLLMVSLAIVSTGIIYNSGALDEQNSDSQLLNSPSFLNFLEWCVKNNKVYVSS
jgi:hypothetical protein